MLEKSTANILRTDLLLFGLFLKLRKSKNKKINGAPMKPSKFFASNTQGVIFFFSLRQELKYPSGQMRQLYASLMQINPSDDWLKTG